MDNSGDPMRCTKRNMRIIHSTLALALMLGVPASRADVTARYKCE